MWHGNWHPLVVVGNAVWNDKWKALAAKCSLRTQARLPQFNRYACMQHNCIRGKEGTQAEFTATLLYKVMTSFHPLFFLFAPVLAAIGPWHHTEGPTLCILSFRCWKF